MACVCDAVGTAVLQARFELDDKIRALDELNRRTREWFANADKLPRPMHAAVQGNSVLMLWTSNTFDKIEVVLKPDNTADLTCWIGRIAKTERCFWLHDRQCLVDALVRYLTTNA